jgi:hypothetical protein
MQARHRHRHRIPKVLRRRGPDPPVRLAVQGGRKGSRRFLRHWDEDHERENNPGVTKRLEAANEISARFALPFFSDESGQPGTDFNDLHAAAGSAAVKGQIDSAQSFGTETGNDRLSLVEEHYQLRSSRHSPASLTCGIGSSLLKAIFHPIRELALLFAGTKVGGKFRRCRAIEFENNLELAQAFFCPSRVSLQKPGSPVIR